MTELPPSGEGGGGPGGLTPSGSRRTAHELRMRRLERRTLVAKLKLVMAGEAAMDEDLQRCLHTFREGLTAGRTIVTRGKNGDPDGVMDLPDTRERRLSAEAIVDFYMKVAQLGDTASPTVNIDAREQTVNVHKPADMREWCRDVAERLKNAPWLEEEAGGE